MYTTTKKTKSVFSSRPELFHTDHNGITTYCLDIEEVEKEDEEGNTIHSFEAYVVRIPEIKTQSNCIKYAIKTLWPLEDENELQNNYVAGEKKLYPFTEENNAAKAKYVAFLQELIKVKEQVKEDFL